jgi:hypothetical protein
MLMLTAFVAALGITFVAGGDLRLLSEIRLRKAWLCALALGIQVLVISVAPSGAYSAAGHIGSYLVAAAFVIVNRKVPGLWLIALGAGMNFLAIISNGGVMPASSGALELAGHPVASGQGFDNSAAVSDANFAVLGDVFAIPEPWIFANVFSVGDVAIAAGLVVGMLGVCRGASRRRAVRPA